MELTNNTIVVVDDDRAALAQIAQFTGAIYIVKTTASKDQAIAWLENDPSIVCMVAEQFLKHGRGLDLLKSAKSVRPLVRRIMATRYADLTDIVEGVHTGIINRMISKPYSSAEVLQALAQPTVISPPGVPAISAANFAT